MTKKRASDLRVWDSCCTVNPIGRAKIVDIRPSQTELKSRAGKYEMALMILHVPIDDRERVPADCTFVCPSDFVQVP